MAFFETTSPNVLDMVFDNLRLDGSNKKDYFFCDHESNPDFFSKAAVLDVTSGNVSSGFRGALESYSHKTAMTGIYQEAGNRGASVSSNVSEIVERGHTDMTRRFELRISPYDKPKRLMSRLYDSKFLGKEWPNITVLRIYGINRGENTASSSDESDVGTPGSSESIGGRMSDDDGRLPDAVNYHLSKLNFRLCKALPNLKKVVYYYKGDRVYGEPLVEVLVREKLNSLTCIDTIDSDFYSFRLGRLPPTVLDLGVNVQPEQGVVPLQIFAPTIQSLRLNLVDPRTFWDMFYTDEGKSYLGFNSLKTLYLRFDESVPNHRVPLPPKPAMFDELKVLGIKKYSGDLNALLDQFPLRQISELVVGGERELSRLDLTPLTNLDTLKLIFNHALDPASDGPWSHRVLTSNSGITALDLSYYAEYYLSGRFMVPGNVQLDQLQFLGMFVHCGTGQLSKLLKQLPRLRQLTTTYEMLGDTLADADYGNINMHSVYDPISTSVAYFGMQGGLPADVSEQELHALVMLLARMPNLKRLHMPRANTGRLRARIQAVLGSEYSSHVQHLRGLLNDLARAE